MLNEMICINCILSFLNISCYVLEMTTISLVKLNLYTLKYFSFQTKHVSFLSDIRTFMGENQFTLEK